MSQPDKHPRSKGISPEYNLLSMGEAEFLLKRVDVLSAAIRAIDAKACLTGSPNTGPDPEEGEPQPLDNMEIAMMCRDALDPIL